jgi:hypothetical protein
MKREESINPGTIAAANNRTIETCNVGPMTTSIMLGGMRMPRVPPAVIAPAESATLYPDFFMRSPAINPIITTPGVTIPVAAANKVADRRAARYKEPFIGPVSNWMAWNRRVISPLRSRT